MRLRFTALAATAANRQTATFPPLIKIYIQSRVLVCVDRSACISTHSSAAARLSWFLWRGLTGTPTVYLFDDNPASGARQIRIVFTVRCGKYQQIFAACIFYRVGAVCWDGYFNATRACNFMIFYCGVFTLVINEQPLALINHVNHFISVDMKMIATDSAGYNGYNVQINNFLRKSQRFFWSFITETPVIAVVC